ncbi:peptide deformylase [Kaistella sp.]|uniref:peptide deformylase n=1 Tax=Kaistella sp. TaxID=2782235 RepID=UPI0035A1575F
MKRISILFLLFSVFVFSQKYTKQEVSRITEGNIDSALPIFQTSDSLQHAVLVDQSIDAKPKDQYTKILVNRMKLALISTGSGVGIAAPQVGINRNVIWAKRFDKEGHLSGILISDKIEDQRMRTFEKVELYKEL